MKKYRIATAMACAFALTVGMTSAMAAESTSAVASKDMRKLSDQGGKAFQEVELARLAIFNGHPDVATQLITKAQESLKKAQADGTAFEKAETALISKAPYKNPTPTADATQSVSWLPVGGDVTIADDYTSDPAKSAAVAKANAHLKKGERDAAIETLRLADVNLAYTIVVVPMSATIAEVNNASELLSVGKYYEANLALKQVEGSVRYDWADFNATPAASQGAANK